MTFQGTVMGKMAGEVGAELVQRGHHYAIVDEVDSILIDEARTPLIISGPADDSPELYIRVNRVVPNLVKQEAEDGEGDFWVDEKGKQVHLSEAGMEHAEQLLVEAGILDGETEGLYAPQNLTVVHHLNAALRAHAIYQRDVDYIVRDAEEARDVGLAPLADRQFHRQPAGLVRDLRKRGFGEAEHHRVRI